MKYLQRFSHWPLQILQHKTGEHSVRNLSCELYTIQNQWGASRLLVHLQQWRQTKQRKFLLPLGFQRERPRFKINKCLQVIVNRLLITCRQSSEQQPSLSCCSSRWSHVTVAPRMPSCRRIRFEMFRPRQKNRSAGISLPSAVLLVEWCYVTSLCSQSNWVFSYSSLQTGLLNKVTTFSPPCLSVLAVLVSG